MLSNARELLKFGGGELDERWIVLNRCESRTEDFHLGMRTVGKSDGDVITTKTCPGRNSLSKYLKQRGMLELLPCV